MTKINYLLKLLLILYLSNLITSQVVSSNNCSNPEPYQFETTKICLEQCKDFHLINETKQCYVKCPSSYPLQLKIKDNKYCTAQCTDYKSFTLQDAQICLKNCRGFYQIIDRKICYIVCPSEYPFSYKIQKQRFCALKCPNNQQFWLQTSKRKMCIQKCSEQQYIVYETKQCVSACPNESSYQTVRNNRTICSQNCQPDKPFSIEIDDVKKCVKKCPKKKYYTDNYNKRCVKKKRIQKISVNAVKVHNYCIPQGDWVLVSARQNVKLQFDKGIQINNDKAINATKYLRQIHKQIQAGYLFISDKSLIIKGEQSKKIYKRVKSSIVYLEESGCEFQTQDQSQVQYIYQWQMSGKTCHNVEWKLFTCHIRITPKQFKPKCPLGQCVDQACSQCFCYQDFKPNNQPWFNSQGQTCSWYEQDKARCASTDVTPVINFGRNATESCCTCQNTEEAQNMMSKSIVQYQNMPNLCNQCGSQSSDEYSLSQSGQQSYCVGKDFDLFFKIVFIFIIIVLDISMIIIKFYEYHNKINPNRDYLMGHYAAITTFFVISILILFIFLVFVFDNCFLQFIFLTILLIIKVIVFVVLLEAIFG